MGLGDLFFLVELFIYQTYMGVLSWANFPGGGEGEESPVRNIIARSAWYPHDNKRV